MLVVKQEDELMPLHIMGVVLVMGSWCVNAIDFGSKAVQENMILDCAYHDKELGLHSLCNCITGDSGGSSNGRRDLWERGQRWQGTETERRKVGKEEEDQGLNFVRKYGKTVDIQIIYGQFIVMSKDCRESNIQRASFMLKVES